MYIYKEKRYQGRIYYFKNSTFYLSKLTIVNSNVPKYVIAWHVITEKINKMKYSNFWTLLYWSNFLFLNFAITRQVMLYCDFL